MKIICTNCGRELDAGINFCPYCGASIKQKPEAPEAGEYAQVTSGQSDAGEYAQWASGQSDAGRMQQQTDNAPDEKHRRKKKHRIILSIICAAAAVCTALSLFQFVYMPRKARSHYSNFWLYGAPKYGYVAGAINHNLKYRITKIDVDTAMYTQSYTFDYGKGEAKINSEYEWDDGDETETDSRTRSYDRYGNTDDMTNVETDRYHRVLHYESEDEDSGGEAVYDCTYYANGELKTFDMESDEIVHYVKYDEHGNPLSAKMEVKAGADPFSMKTEYTPIYNDQGRLTRMESTMQYEDTEENDSGTGLENSEHDVVYEYEYDSHGNCVKITSDDDSVTEISYEKIP